MMEVNNSFPEWRPQTCFFCYVQLDNKDNLLENYY